jgi:glycosyltransferase involved in cell wall biosynthesis
MPYDMRRELLPFLDRKRFFTKLHWMADRFGTGFCNSVVRNREARKGDFDIVHIQNIIAPIDQYLLRYLAGKVPLIMTVHDTIPHVEKFVQRRSFLQRAYKHFDHLIVHYEGGKRNLIETYGVPAEKIVVIPHGLTMLDNFPHQEDARQQLGIPLDKRILLFFGTIRPDKGLDILIQAMGQLKDERNNAMLVIAGKPSGEANFAEFNDLIKSLSLESHVIKSIRFIPDEEISDFFSAADICVLPYRQFDSQSGVLMQAYIHYKPILATDVGGIGDIVRADGIGVVVPPADVTALAQGIKEILHNYDRYLGRCGRETTIKYSWPHSAALTVKCYQDFL